MNKLDLDYQDLLKDILENGIKKQTRNGEVLSLFGRQIKHKMSDGFPLLSTKKMHWKSIVTELLWFLNGRTDLKWLLEQGNTIWVGDAWMRYINEFRKTCPKCPEITQEEFINKIKTDDEFAKKWGNLGPIYGKQWRKWRGQDGMIGEKDENGTRIITWNQIDQIQNLINELKTNPDSRRLMVNAWNVGELDQMVLPPCHYGFQVYTRELSAKERLDWYGKNGGPMGEVKMVAFVVFKNEEDNQHIHEWLEKNAPNVPTRAISLMWNQRSVDFGLGAPFNIASYGLLLEIIAKEVNMVPDELIGNLGDVHLYLNHVEPIKEQLNREPYPLPTLRINTEFWGTESRECGVGPLKTNLQGFEVSDFILENYQSHPTIKLPLSN